MKINNEQYVPVIIKDVVQRIEKLNKNSNDYVTGINILIATQQYINQALKKQKIKINN